MMHVAIVDTPCVMEYRGERLRQARIGAGYPSAAKAADAIGVNASTYRAHENGQNDFGIEEAERYAKFFRTNSTWLLTGKPEPGVKNGVTISPKKPAKLGMVPIKGTVSAGTWQDIDSWGASPMDDYVPSSSEYPLEWQYAFVVEGESLNRVARSGDRLVCLDLAESGISIADGDLVIMERWRFAGQMIERTAKRARKTLAGFELWPESDDPAHQEPVPYRGGESDEVRVVAKVLWILRKP